MSKLYINSGIVPVPNGEIYYERFGAGEPLILIHAGFSDRRDWTHQMEDLGRKFDTIIYDQRGAGNSSTITGLFSPAEDLKSLMDNLEISKAVLVGHSIGGTIALDFALQYPDRVSSLVLIAPGLNGYSWSNEYIELMQSIWKDAQPEKMATQFLSAPFYAVSMQNPNIKSEIEMITQEAFHKVLTWKTFDVRDVHWYYPNPISELQKLAIHTLVIYGDKDSQDIKTIAQILNENILDAKICIIKNTDHLINFEKPKELNELVLDFILKNNFNR